MLPGSRGTRLAAGPVLSWPLITNTAGADVIQGLQLRPGAKPATSPTATIAPTANPESSKPVVLYRDTNAWCPYCQRCWMVLLEKNIPFDTVLIDLFDKPEWYSEVASNKQTPAIVMDGEPMCESLDIMLHLESKFPETPLTPSDPAATEAMLRFLKTTCSEGLSSLVSSMRVGADAEAVAGAAAFLDEIEALVTESGGPFIFGAFSMADINIAPFLPPLAVTDAATGTLSLAERPACRSLFAAIRARGTYLETAVDDETRSLIRRFMMDRSSVPPTVDISGVSAQHMTARREAAAKIAANRKEIIPRIVQMSGVVRRQGSRFGRSVKNINGTSTNPHAVDFQREADAALQRVCSLLLSGYAGPSPSAQDAVAVQVAVLMYLRNLGSAPRDMTAPALEQLRAACDAVVQVAYEFPESQLRQRRDS